MIEIAKITRAGLLCLSGGLLLLVAPQRVAAQYSNPHTFRNWNNPISNYLDVRLQQRMQQRRLEERILQRQRASDPSAAESAPSGNAPPTVERSPISATDFRATGTRLLPDTLAAAIPDLTAEQKEQLRTLYVQVLAAFEEQARKNNVAYALTVLIGTSMQVVNNRELSEAETERLAEELNDVLASSPEFRRLSPRQKQSLYEAAIITGGMIGVIHQIGVDQGNAELKGQANTLAEEVISQLLGKRAG